MVLYTRVIHVDKWFKIARWSIKKGDLNCKGHHKERRSKLKGDLKWEGVLYRDRCSIERKVVYREKGGLCRERWAIKLGGQK